MDTATNIECNILDIEEDGTYYFNWAWTYVGGEPRSGVYEHLLVERPDGWLLGGKRESAHEASPGQTYMGASTRGDGRLNPGENVWHFFVYSEAGEILGDKRGNIFAAIPERDG